MSLRDEALKAMAECECPHCEIRVTKALDALLEWLVARRFNEDEAPEYGGEYAVDLSTYDTILLLGEGEG